jgi:hypothetical protein
MLASFAFTCDPPFAGVDEAEGAEVDLDDGAVDG